MTGPALAVLLLAAPVAVVDCAGDRFVSPSRSLQVAVMVTYHLAQLGLVASLVLSVVG